MSRLRGRPRTIDVDELIAQTRNRAHTKRYAGHPSAVSRVRAVTASTHHSARRLGLADVNAVDAYVDADELDSLVGAFGLVADEGGLFTLRATSMDMGAVDQLAATSDVVAALDLAESQDVRERSAGTRALGAALEAFCHI